MKKYKIISIEIKQSERADLVFMSPDFDFFMKRLEASMRTPDLNFRYMITITITITFTKLPLFRLRFTVQSGEAWVLTKEDISSSFSIEVLDVNFINPYKTAGFLFFNGKEDAEMTDNSVVEVKGCVIHAHVDLNNLPPFPSDHQILIESQCLPISWEWAIILRKFFEGFGEVTGIIRKKQMLVISFKKAIAAKLTGRLLQVKFNTIIIKLI